MSADQGELARRLILACDLSDFGIALKRQQMRRENPGISEGELDRRMAAWRHHPPGAKYGDADGKVVPWPRPRR